MIAVGLEWDRESRDMVSIRLLGNRVGGREMRAVGLERWDRKSRGRVSIASNEHRHPVLYIHLSTCLACLRPLTHQPRHTHARTYKYTHQPRPVPKLASLIYIQFHSFPAPTAPCFRHRQRPCTRVGCFSMFCISRIRFSLTAPPRAHLGTHARSLVRFFNCPMKLDKKSGTRSAERSRSAMRWYLPTTSAYPRCTRANVSATSSRLARDPERPGAGGPPSARGGAVETMGGGGRRVGALRVQQARRWRFISKPPLEATQTCGFPRTQLGCMRRFTKRLQEVYVAGAFPLNIFLSHYIIS